MEKRPWYRHYDDHIDPYQPIPDILVSDVLTANSEPHQVALHYLGREITFGELEDSVNRMAAAFSELGVKKGDRIGIHLPNIPQYVIAYYAAMYLGAVIVNFSPLYTPHELVSLIRKTEPEILVTFDQVLPVVKKVVEEVAVPIVIATGIFDFMDGSPHDTRSELETGENWFHFLDLLEKDAATIPVRVEMDQDEPAMIQFTGGTTGVPKGAVLTHKNIISAIVGCSRWGEPVTQKTPPGERVAICVMPLFHVLANVNCMGWAMFNCAKLVLIPRFEIELFMDKLSEFEKITFLPTVPTMINAVINHPRAEESQLESRLDLLNSGGGPMPVELIEKIKAHGIYYVEGWGMSETTAIGIGNPVVGLKKNGSIGIPLPGLDIRLVDLETGSKEVKRGEPGELVVKGSFVMKGYWNQSDQSDSEFRDGWLHTGDIATMDEDGYLYIVDRKKDMIIAGGYNIYPREIDEVLHQHPKVEEAISIGIPHEYRGETVKSYLVLKNGETATHEEIVDFCKERLAVYKVPKLIEFRNELPKSAVGKTLRKVLRQEEAEKTE